MKAVPRLRLELVPSHVAATVVAGGCAATAVLVATLPIPLAAQVAAAAAIAALGWAGVMRCAGRRVPALLHVGADRRITVTDRTGSSRDGTILDDSFVGARVTTIVWQQDHAPRWHPARSILILAGMLPPDDFRRLRVMLRYGRPATGADTIGEAAG